ncbi:hypothetical protein AB0C59_02055 [Streptomyces sp. NPDC048664]|uniref:hypothetical protein n=1 Tax=Streptomyces sp. NPDC048664 TaxID=3154505 RepID=UPI00341741F1
MTSTNSRDNTNTTNGTGNADSTRWKARLALALARRSVDRVTVDAVLDEVDQHCAQSGERPEEAFGSAEEYAAAVVRDRQPPEQRAHRRWDGTTFTDHVRVALAQTGIAALVGGACTWAWAGTRPTVTPAALAGGALTGVALLSACLAASLAGSRVRGSIGWGVGAAAAVVAAAAAFTRLPTTSLGRPPAPALCVLGILMLWAAARHEPTRTPTPDESAMPPPPRSENWLVTLPRLLEERHGLSRARATALAGEAARHLAATGRAPEEEFGPVEVYALRLAEEQSAPRARRWTRGDAQAALLAVVLAGYLAANLASGGPLWLTVLAAVALATQVALLGAEVRRKRSTG